MWEPREERRRAPSLTPPEGCRVNFTRGTGGQVLDISPGGALFLTRAPLRGGQRAQVRVELGSEAVEAQAEVRWSKVNEVEGSNEFLVGVAFVSPSQETQRAIWEFVGRGRNRSG